VRIETSDVKARVDLVALVASRGIELRKSGSQFVGLCPFHDERTPSFYVAPERGFYCHGCGAKGDAIEFLMRLDGLDFAQALEQLAGGVHERPARRPAAPSAGASPEAPARNAAALWALLSTRDEAGEAYLTGRGLLYRDPDVLRFNVGASGDSWLDGRAREGYRVAFAVRNAAGQVQTISLRRVNEEEPKKLHLAGCPTKSAAIVSPEITQLALGDPEFAADRIIIVEGGTDWLAASALFAGASAEYGSPPTWPLAALGVSQAAGVVEAFAAVTRIPWRTVLVGLDADTAGRAAAPAVAEAARKAGARDVIRAEPPMGAKDWGELARTEWAHG